MTGKKLLSVGFYVRCPGKFTRSPMREFVNSFSG